MATEQNPIETIEDYIQTFPAEVQEILQQIRKVIHAAAPEVEEIISYRIAGFRLDGKYLVYCAGFKNHVSLYPRTAGVDAQFGAELAPYASGKGTLQFKLNEPMPHEFIKRVVEFRVKEHRQLNKKK